MEHTLKRKVTVKLTFNDSKTSSRPPSRNNSRPPSPVKSLSAQSPLASPPIRPRAKVNSSATPASSRKPPSSVTNTHVSSSRSTVSASSRPGSSASTTPRPTSPAKPPSTLRTGALSPTFQPKTRATVRSGLRSNTPQPTPSVPDLRQRSLTTASAEAGRYIPSSRSRHGSVSLHHTASFSSLQGSSLSSGSRSPPLPAPDLAPHSDHEGRRSPPIRIKSKVTGIAKSASETLSPLASAPSYPTSRLGGRLTRTPSVSSNISVSTSPPAPTQPPTFYPITTATPAANPHRFATARHSPPQAAHHYYQPFHQPLDDAHVSYKRPNGIAKVDPTTIPLPTTSPPASAISFSSRSSVSRSSVSYVTESLDSHSSAPTNQTQDVAQLRSTLDNLMKYSEMNAMEDNYSGDSGQDRDTDGELDVTERKVKAEAKSNRKIADLEITNRSLLAINASLETAKHRQAKEIRDLRRKLRESRLILPPRAYRAVQSSLEHDDTVDEDDDDDENNEEEHPDGDEVYKRIQVIIEGLLETGRRALETTPADFSDGGKSVAKVLNADEIRSWRGATSGLLTKTLNGSGDILVSPSLVAIPDDDGDLNSEEEVEAMALSAGFNYSPPPILITESP